MKIIYNPIETGSPIGNDPKHPWRFNFKKYSHPVGQILQYTDDVAEALCTTYPFLQELTKAQAEKKLEDLKAEFKCQVCGEGFSAKIALAGHMRKHPSEETGMDPSIVPIAEGEAIIPYVGPETPQMQRPANPGYIEERSKLTNDPQDAGLLDFGSYEKAGK